VIDTTAALVRHDDPYVYYTADGVVSARDLQALNAAIPDREIYERCVKQGEEHRKQYTMWRCEPALDSRRTAVADRLTEPWSDLVDGVLSADFRQWLTDGVGVDVRTLPVTVGLYVFEDGDYTTNDTGKLEKALSFGLYLNSEWKSAYGGAFQVFTDKSTDDGPVRELVPVGGRCVTMTPTETTWHRIERIDTGGRVPRLLLMVEFWRS
jgi:2OG-Fe(II) oxygenase superfamily